MTARCWFDSCPSALPNNNPGQVVHTHVPLFIKQYNLVPVKGQWCSVAGKVTVGLASPSPCITDSVVYPPTVSTAIEREMSTPSMPLWDTAPLPYFTYMSALVGCRRWHVRRCCLVYLRPWRPTKALLYQFVCLRSQTSCSNTQQVTDSQSVTLKFNTVLEVVKVVRVYAKFQQAKCSSSWAIVLNLTEKQKKTRNSVQSQKLT